MTETTQSAEVLLPKEHENDKKFFISQKDKTEYDSDLQQLVEGWPKSTKRVAYALLASTAIAFGMKVSGIENANFTTRLITQFNYWALGANIAFLWGTRWNKNWAEERQQTANSLAINPVEGNNSFLSTTKAELKRYAQKIDDIIHRNNSIKKQYVRWGIISAIPFFITGPSQQYSTTLNVIYTLSAIAVGACIGGWHDTLHNDINFRKEITKFTTSFIPSLPKKVAQGTTPPVPTDTNIPQRQ